MSARAASPWATTMLSVLFPSNFRNTRKSRWNRLNICLFWSLLLLLLVNMGVLKIFTKFIKYSKLENQKWKGNQIAEAEIF